MKTIKRGKVPKGKAKKGKAAKKGSGRKPSGPRSQALPGMEQVRNVRLDRFCESLGEIRDKMGALRFDESGDMQGALTEMHTKGLTAYHHAGVELVRVAGAEKIRVRVISKDKASAATEPDADENIDTAGTGTEG